MAAKTYKQFVKTFKFRAKKPSESARAFIGARGKAMGKEWQAMKKKAGGAATKVTKATKAAKAKAKPKARKAKPKAKAKGKKKSKK
jgi:type IV secretory pathway TrbL component